jgi:two-component system, OmpR family, alkaline phosphatase synthesis response regulator PhoP
LNNRGSICYKGDKSVGYPVKKILVIEDEQDIVNLLSHYLRQEGYEILTARDGFSGLKLARTEAPGLVILDLMLPEFGGLEVCKKLRVATATAEIPIIMLTAKGEESDKIVGLELGADDYITKPFSPKELVARVKALLRRSGRPEKEEAVFVYGPIAVDVSGHVVKADGNEVRLTAKEFGLLVHLIQNKGRVLTRDVLLDRVWGYDSDVTTRTVDVHIRRLREKIPFLSGAIVTVLSHGYKLRDENE